MGGEVGRGGGGGRWVDGEVGRSGEEGGVGRREEWGGIRRREEREEGGEGGMEGEGWASATKAAAWTSAPSRSSRDLTWKACLQIADATAMGGGCARAVGPAFWGAHCEQRASLSRDIYPLALARGSVSLARLFGMLFTTCQIGCFVRRIGCFVRDLGRILFPDLSSMLQETMHETDNHALEQKLRKLVRELPGSKDGRQKQKVVADTTGALETNQNTGVVKDSVGAYVPFRIRLASSRSLSVNWPTCSVICTCSYSVIALTRRHRLSLECELAQWCE